MVALFVILFFFTGTIPGEGASIKNKPQEVQNNTEDLVASDLTIESNKDDFPRPEASFFFTNIGPNSFEYRGMFSHGQSPFAYENIDGFLKGFHDFSKFEKTNGPSPHIPVFTQDPYFDKNPLLSGFKKTDLYNINKGNKEREQGLPFGARLPKQEEGKPKNIYYRNPKPHLSKPQNSVFNVPRLITPTFPPPPFYNIPKVNRPNSPPATTQKPFYNKPQLNPAISPPKASKKDYLQNNIPALHTREPYGIQHQNSIFSTQKRFSQHSFKGADEYPKIFTFTDERINIVDFDHKKKAGRIPNLKKGDYLDRDRIPRNKFLILHGGMYSENVPLTHTRLYKPQPIKPLVSTFYKTFTSEDDSEIHEFLYY